MTFVVVAVEGEQQHVLGTIWADEERKAQTIANDLVRQSGTKSAVELRRTEEQEIPLKLPA